MRGLELRSELGRSYYLTHNIWIGELTEIGTVDARIQDYGNQATHVTWHDNFA